MKPSCFSLVMLVSAIAQIFFACSEDSPNSSGAENGGSSSSLSLNIIYHGRSSSSVEELSSSSSHDENVKRNTTQLDIFCVKGEGTTQEMVELDAPLDPNCEIYVVNAEAWFRKKPSLGINCPEILDYTNKPNMEKDYCINHMYFESLNDSQDASPVIISDEEAEKCVMEYNPETPAEHFGNTFTAERFAKCAKEQFEAGFLGEENISNCLKEFGTRRSSRESATGIYNSCKNSILTIE